MVLYLIENTVDGKQYVGTTVRPLKARMSDHRSAAFRANRQQPLYRAIRSCGWQAFEVVELASTDDYEELLLMEQEAIRERETLFPSGYNVVRGGRGNLGWKPSEGTKARIAAKARGRTPWNKGIPNSVEARAKMSAVRKGRPKTAAQLATPQCQRGRRWGNEALLRLAQSKGETWREKQRAAHLGRPRRSVVVRGENNT